MNKAFFLLLTLVLVTACKTSGDLRAEKIKDPSEVRTVGVPPPVQQKERERVPPQAQMSQMQTEELARQVEILKGQLQEKDYLHQQEKAQLDTRLQALETERARLIEEVLILKGAAPAASAQGGDLLWETAMKDLRGKKFSEAAATLKDFMDNFPKDPRVEQAHILKGQSEYASNQFKASLVTFGAI